MKKVLSLALAIIMLLGSVTVAFAAVDGASCKIAIVPMESSYNTGDIVTFKVNLETSGLGRLGAVKLLGIGFNSNAFEYIEDISSKPGLDKQSTVDVAGYPEQNYIDLSNSFIEDGDTSKLDASETAKGWNKILIINTCQALPAENNHDCSAGEVTFFTFKLKVKDAAAAGNYAVGVVKNAGTQVWEEEGDLVEDAELAGILGVPSVFQLVDANVTIGAPASASILNPLKSQIRFDKNADGTYAGTFDVRQLAVVSKAKFEGTFGATVEAQKAAIAEVGFVFARTSTVATFDVDTAKALIESGTAAAGYTKKTVDYITTNAGVVGADNYGISCIIEDLPTADNTDGMYALAYIKGNDGTFHYYPAAELTSFNTLYNTHYNSAFPA